MDKNNFKIACDKVINIERERNGIGTLSEKTLHAVLKHYYEPNEENHEIKVGKQFCDILKGNEVFEIQTRGFNTLRKKLDNLLPNYVVTIIHPIAKTKYLSWIDLETGETTMKRKSPKQGSVYHILYELYKIKPYLSNKNLKFIIPLIDISEYRYLNGWSKDKKKGSSRCDQIPIDIVDEVNINSILDYSVFLPSTLPEEFTSKDYKKEAKISISVAQNSLNILYSLNIVDRIGKNGNSFIYKINT